MRIAIVGATGLVGRKTLEILEEKGIEADYVLFASANSDGKIIEFKNNKHKIIGLSENSIKENPVDFVLFCAGAKVAKQYVPMFIENNATVIDFSSNYRKTEAPLIVPEVNAQILKNQKLICNPNCSTIGAVVFLNQIHKSFGLEKVIVSTYQAVSGAGKNALDDLLGCDMTLKKFDYPIKDNILCYIGELENNKYTNEEMKMVNELRKIFDDTSIKINSTCVRVPVSICHGESIWFRTKKDCTYEQVLQALKNTQNIVLVDDYPHYPMPIECKNQDKVFVGRLRADLDEKNCFSAYIVSDNLRKGASSNGVQILIELLKKGE